MSDNKNDTVDFIQEMMQKLVDVSWQENGYEHLEKFPLNTKQCLYVFNWKKGGISFEIGLQKLLGYTKEELYFKDMIEFIHPEDRYLVENITKEAVRHTYATSLPKTSAQLFITYRFRKKDGDYLRLMRQTSSYEFNNEGNMKTNVSILTDITFMGMRHTVDWDLQSDGLDITEFKEKIYGVYRKIFTNREKEVIQSIEKGLTTVQIAKKMFVSHHTVSTHRKKIFKKARVNNITDLIFFCKKNGIID